MKFDINKTLSLASILFTVGAIHNGANALFKPYHSQKSQADDSNNNSTGANYTDDFGRNKIFPMAAAAYSNDPSACLNNTFTNATLYRFVNVTCGDSDDYWCSGFTAVNHDDQSLILSFRGTDSFLQLLTESSDTLLEKMVESPIAGNVSEYFMDAFVALWYTNGSMSDDFNQMINDWPDYDELWVTGHSLGGAIAVIAAAQIVADQSFNTSKIKLVTLGQPRTGNIDWATAFDQRLPSYRITHKRDIVVHMPPHDFQNYTHHMSEVWYDNNMKVGANFTSCDDVESPYCANSIKHWFSVKDHTHYFEEEVGDYGENGCI